MKAKRIIEALGRELWGDSKDAEAVRLAGDASAREFYRLRRGDESYVLCLDASLDAQKIHVFLRLYEVLKKHGVRLPEIYRHDAEKGYFLQEYLGDTTFLQCVSRSTGTEDEYGWYKSAIDLLLDFHGIEAGQYKGEDFTGRFLCQERLMSEVRTTCDYFFRDYLGVAEDEANLLIHSFRDICRLTGQGDKVVTHRDFHSKNIMVKGGACVAIDFQDTMMGIAQYDLVSLLDDCYYKVSEANKQKLKRYYWEASGRREEFDDFCYLYDLMLIQRAFKAVGSFAYIFKEKGNNRYLRHIGFAMENIRTTLLRYGRFGQLRDILASLYYGR